MKFIKNEDEKCFSLSQMQAGIFERAAKDQISSYFFIKVYMHSDEVNKLDDESIFYTGLSRESIYLPILRKMKKTSGEAYPIEIMHWIGYFYRTACYLTGKRSKWMFNQISPSYLKDVYYTYHSLDITKAVQLVLDSKIQKEETDHERIMRILRETWK